MRWLGLTLGLLAACGCLIAWVYLRDRDAAGWRVPESQLARADATIVLESEDCHVGCTVGVRGRAAGAEHRWSVRLTVQGRPQCLQIDLDTFTVTHQDGLAGVRPERCPPARARRSRSA
jgi:hypothetical protein